MARGRRRGGSRRKTSRAVRTDWTYNMSSYANNGTSLVGGVAGGLMFPLTISQNARRLSTFGTNLAVPAAGSWESWSAIPEGSRQKVYEVDGFLRLDPATWAVGSELTFGWRLFHAEMDPLTGGAILPTGYSMWVNGPVSIAQYANAGFLKEFRDAQSAAGTAVSNKGEWFYRVHWQSARGVEIGNSRALYLLVESIAGSVSARTSTFLRCRMRADA